MLYSNGVSNNPIDSKKKEKTKKPIQNWENKICIDPSIFPSQTPYMEPTLIQPLIPIVIAPPETHAATPHPNLTPHPTRLPIAPHQLPHLIVRRERRQPGPGHRGDEI